MMGEANEKPEMEADVAVIGYGGAGTTATITEHDNGARVIILARMPSLSATRVSPAIFSRVNLPKKD